MQPEDQVLHLRDWAADTRLPRTLHQQQALIQECLAELIDKDEVCPDESCRAGVRDGMAAHQAIVDRGPDDPLFQLACTSSLKALFDSLYMLHIKLSDAPAPLFSAIMPPDILARVFFTGILMGAQSARVQWDSDQILGQVDSLGVEDPFSES
jgi:hypothetical protein